MKTLFPEDRESAGERCRRLLGRYCHPVQIGTGVLFGSIGVGLTAAGVMYSDGLNFLLHGAPHITGQIANGTDIGGSVDYVRESYKGSVQGAMEAGWKQLPFSYCIGHYVGGRLRDGVARLVGRR